MTGKPHLSTFALDALALDALTSDEADQARLHLASCAHCRANAELGAQFRSHFATRVEPTLGATRDRRRHGQWWFAVKWISPVLAVAAILLVWVRLRAVEATAPGEPELGIKGGGPVFEVYARRGHQIFAVKQGSTLTSGDEIRFAVTPQKFRYVLIASLDGSGQVTFYYPYHAERSAEVAPDRRTELPGSIVLDATPGPERLVAAFSHTPIRAVDLQAELLRHGSQPKRPALDHVAQVSLSFEKSR